jgi:spermidine synthase
MNIEINVPDGVSGDWSISTFTVDSNEFSQKISMWKTGRYVPGGTYKRLMRNGTVVMSNTPDEISDFLNFLYKAKGSILINGLGLGVTLKALLDIPEVTDITVIEKSEDVIKLVAPTYTDPRVTIINADAFTWIPPKDKMYDCVWHDIWDYICADNLPEMKKLHRKYGRRTKYQESWCRYQCERQRRNWI